MQTITNDDLLVMVKVAERCNIACSYCYMYNGVDQSWRSRPKTLSDESLGILCDRLASYRRGHPAARMTLEIHGGEPLLLGKERTRKFLENVRRSLPPDDLFIVTQSNGILIDDEWLDMYASFDATIAISCDGPEAVHDRHRIDHRRAGTGASTARSIKKCIEFDARNGAAVFNGVLCVVDPHQDPEALLSYFFDLGVRDMDLLLPDANHFSPPSHLKDYRHESMERFFCSAFDAWLERDDPDFRIRIFETFIRAMLGQRPELDAFGGDLVPIVVVESDGSYRLIDVLSICQDGVSATSLHLAQNELEEFRSVAQRRYPKPCKECQTCEAFKTCGGGYLPHRFDGRSYERPSFYCSTLLKLHQHISRRMPQTVRE